MRTSSPCRKWTNWRAEAAGYGLHRARFRHLPSDHQILESLLRIPNPRWRLAYGLMATYGLRNHEVFFSDLSAFFFPHGLLTAVLQSRARECEMPIMALDYRYS